MKIEIIKQLHKSFEEAAYEEGGLEYWLARELQSLLGYSDWRNFMSIVNKAKESCINVGIDPNYHFVDVNKMINLPKNAIREVEDIMLTRYACYLIAQNGDPKKPEDLPAEVDIKKLQRKIKLEDKNILREAKKPKGNN